METMFPSLEAEAVAKLISEEFMKTDIKVEEVDYKELGIYIAHNWSPGKIKLEGINKACPSRRFNRGPRPTIHGKEAKGGKQSGGGAESK